ncbi:MAG: 2-amino-4-hydroxy-6-hydroxymethyldihydropteridine diphosphokinase [Paramuribaculum sp.]|nr:2-amino-4-hydroxy-6-hydroxymethyldihydropteridine diphosphokinase [Paramuribaculum sp.]
MPEAYINIGSNIGDRPAQIERAVTGIKRTLDMNALISEPYYSEAQGFESENEFINVGMLIHSELDPFELLTILQTIENEIDPTSHRDQHGNYTDRRIDVDLIFYGEWEIKSDRLILPHPRMNERDFVLEPLKWLREQGLSR